MGKSFYTIEETSKILEITERQVRLLVNMFELEAFRIGKNTLIPIQAILLYRAEKKYIRNLKLEFKKFVRSHEKEYYCE